jgi:ligand-binding sensor domain-containing protein
MYDGKVFTNYTLKNGLIHFHVLSCYEDRKGNLWFGTARGGMYRYDGKVFKLFTKKDGLPDNTITCFEEDKEGNMWFGTENGLSRYDGKSFKNYSTANGLRSNNISSIIIDTSGKIWVGCLATKYMADDGGLCYCIINSDDSSQITETGNAKLFTGFLNRDGRPFKTVTDLFQDKQGKIWIGRFDGLSCYDGRSLTELFPAYLSYYIIDDKQGNIWLTHSELNKEFKNTPRQVLYKYNGNAFTMIMDKYEPDDFQIFGKAVDMEGNIWFGTMKGPCRYDGKNFTYFYENQE